MHSHSRYIRAHLSAKNVDAASIHEHRAKLLRWVRYVYKENMKDGLYLNVFNEMKAMFNEASAKKVEGTFKIKIIRNIFKDHSTRDPDGQIGRSDKSFYRPVRRTYYMATLYIRTCIHTYMSKSDCIAHM